MARLWHRDFLEWPLWLRLLHVATGVLTAIVLVRLTLRGFGFDTWTHLWTAYACLYGLLLSWRTRDGRKGRSEEEEASWFL